MALFFNNASTDKLTTSFTAHATQRSYSAWVYRIGAGGGSTGRVFDKRTASGQTEVLLFSSGLEYDRNWSGGQGSWKAADIIGTNVWQHVAVTYDAGSVSNDPIIYINGASQALILDTNPSGTVNTSTDPYVIGNRGNDNARNFDGYIAEFAIYDRILSAAEIAILSKGYSPAFILDGLVCYYPLIREAIDQKNAAGTVSGASAVSHARVIYPVSRSLITEGVAATIVNHTQVFGDDCLVY